MKNGWKGPTVNNPIDLLHFEVATATEGSTQKGQFACIGVEVDVKELMSLS